MKEYPKPKLGILIALPDEGYFFSHLELDKARCALGNYIFYRKWYGGKWYGDSREYAICLMQNYPNSFLGLTEEDFEKCIKLTPFLKMVNGL